MSKIKAKRKQDQLAAGKRPTRVPRKSTLPPPKVRTSKKPSRDAGSRSRPASTHLMRTRSRAKNFQFMSLPAELRSKVYEDVFSAAEQPLDLNNFKLPTLLSSSRTVREEALPVFFATSTFKATLRSNWCVRNSHWHSPTYVRHNDTGVLELSPLLRDGDGDLAVPKEAVRFHNVDFSVRCVCCVQVIEIGEMQLRVVNRNPIATGRPTSSNVEVKTAWPRFMKDVHGNVEKIGGREKFNGFSVQDLQKLAMCFRHDPAHDHHGDV